jgi:hypothetical protein
MFKRQKGDPKTVKARWDGRYRKKKVRAGYYHVQIRVTDRAKNKRVLKHRFKVVR